MADPKIASQDLGQVLYSILSLEHCGHLSWLPSSGTSGFWFLHFLLAQETFVRIRHLLPPPDLLCIDDEHQRHDVDVQFCHSQQPA